MNLNKNMFSLKWEFGSPCFTDAKNDGNTEWGWINIDRQSPSSQRKK
jgi:hypothetical protein